jgi:hypothetical protein
MPEPPDGKCISHERSAVWKEIEDAAAFRTDSRGDHRVCGPRFAVPGNTMTKSTVAAGSAVNSAVTKGDVAATTASGRSKKLAVTYKGGKQSIRVLPTALVVTLKPGSMSNEMVARPYLWSRPRTATR